MMELLRQKKKKPVKVIKPKVSKFKAFWKKWISKEASNIMSAILAILNIILKSTLKGKKE